MIALTLADAESTLVPVLHLGLWAGLRPTLDCRLGGAEVDPIRDGHHDLAVKLIGDVGLEVSRPTK